MKKNRKVVAVNSKANPIILGNFNITCKSQQVDVYYNIDIGSNNKRIFNINTGKYDDLSQLHRSFHHSGRGHVKECKDGPQLDRGQISDRSKLLNSDEDLLILGIESFNFEHAPMEKDKLNFDVLLDPPAHLDQFSILWILIPPWHADILPFRMLWGNHWGSDNLSSFVRSSSLSDILVTHDLITISKINGWRIGAAYLKKPMPVFWNRDFILSHPGGNEFPWRSFCFVDLHWPLSQMLKEHSFHKPLIYTSSIPKINKSQTSPAAWIKYK